MILLDSVGVGRSGGVVPESFEAMGDCAADFLKTLNIPLVDVVGFSIGGVVAQALTFRHPQVVRRLALLGTIPPAGTMDGAEEKVGEVIFYPEFSLEDFLYLFFGRSAKAIEAGRAFWSRRHQRTEDYNLPVPVAAGQRQQAAVVKWERSIPARRLRRSRRGVCPGAGG